MEANTRMRGLCLALVLVATAAACKQSTGTFVVLTFQGTIPEGKPIRSIGLSLQLGTRTDSTVFQAQGSGAIALPTDATLQINSGSGDLTVEASALAEDQSVLATGTAHARVSAGQTTRITVILGSSKSDAGAALDAQQDSGVSGKDASIDGPSTVADSGDTWPLAPDAADLGNGKNDVSLGGSGGSGQGGANGDAVGLSSGGAPGGTGGTISSGTGGSATGGTSGSVNLAVTPAAPDFGVVAVGSVSAPLTLTITNTGAGTTPALALFVADGHHFPVFQDRCSGAYLKLGNTCTVAFTFNPDVTGTIQTNGSVGPAQGPAAKFTLSGIASNGTPTLAMSPSTVDFKNLDVGISSSIPFTVTNNGAANAGPLKILVNPTTAFQITNDTCSTMTLGKLGQCTFSLVFAPQTIGIASATIAAQSTSGLVATSSAVGVGQDHVQLTVQFAGTGEVRSRGRASTA
jgi:hypothetical protein